MEPPLLQIAKRCSLIGARVRRADEARRVEDITIVWSDVEVPAHRHPLIRRRGGCQPLPKPTEPVQLGNELLGAKAAPIGHVDADHAHAAAGCCHEPPLRSDVGEHTANT